MKTRFLTGTDGTIHAILPPEDRLPRGPGAPTAAKVVPRADQRIHEIEVDEGIVRALHQPGGGKDFFIRNGRLERRST
jgi:hypothetical protein